MNYLIVEIFESSNHEPRTNSSKKPSKSLVKEILVLNHFFRADLFSRTSFVRAQFSRFVLLREVA